MFCILATQLRSFKMLLTIIKLKYMTPSVFSFLQQHWWCWQNYGWDQRADWEYETDSGSTSRSYWLCSWLWWSIHWFHLLFYKKTYINIGYIYIYDEAFVEIHFCCNVDFFYVDRMSWRLNLKNWRELNWRNSSCSLPQLPLLLLCPFQWADQPAVSLRRTLLKMTNLQHYRLKWRCNQVPVLSHIANSI